jgi:hypothetical protein
MPTSGDRWQDLVTSGYVLAASGEGTVAEDPPGDYGVDASARLAAMRDAER